MLDNCLAIVSKSEKSLNLNKLIEVFEFWHKVVKNAKDILIYVGKISFLSNTNFYFDHLNLFSKTKQKDTF